jgi:ribosome-binding factor A
MRPFRNLKMASVIQAELGKLLTRYLDVDGAIVTITRVEIPEDLLQAKVFLSIIPKVKVPEAFREVEVLRGEFQHRLIKKMNVRPMPHIKFFMEPEDEAPTQ